ncbi:uncharacterized protein EV422DRAFT_53275 [Fimicolochytrium jonesii]|uniref:uncharacterized protein n=1 Tax=Fimicolochytrium jonesii TaxID=1396493 RepID=UPI0022FF09CA|nr:uncharacterized protein EV422DRAFT_53275 [Fimicolochytrium jonesii]KAI8821098.1 hypothetical protein EV422DRAFT_53275 [Fimicolochytrium jonesii]
MAGQVARAGKTTKFLPKIWRLNEHMGKLSDCASPSENVTEVLQFIEGRYTFLNPNADRMQMLLELYDHEVKFQFAKIELINAYLEIYEHTSDPKSIKEIGQLITNIVHTRPGYDFESPYFSRAYAMATRTFRIQAQLILDMIKDGVDQHRSWYQKCFGRLDPTLAQNDLDGSQELTVKDEWENAETAKGLRKLDSPISAGLPPKEDGEKQTVTMHHASVILGMTEFVPTLDGIIQIHKIAFSAASEMFGVTEELFRQGRASNLVDSKKKPIAKIDRQAVECAVWKGFHNMWQALYDHSFHIPQPRNRRLIGRIDAELWMENPLMPDIILMDHYQTYGKTDAEPELKHIAARTPFTDPVFKPKAAHICQRLIKLVVLKDRLYYSWRSTENWRRIYEGQFPQLNVNKDAFTGRLNSLKFDFPDVADNTAVEEDYEEETTDGGPDDAQQVAAESDDERDPAVQFGHSYLRFGPLAVAELDEHLASAISLPTPSAPFDLSTVSGINTSLRPEPMRQMAFSLKIQTVEKFWHMAAVELHHLLLSEVHAKLLIEGTPAKIEKAKGWERRSPQRHGETPTTQKTLDVDYRLLITAIVPKKKALRKMMLTEYNKGFRTSGNMTEEERDQVSTTYKYNLYEWYYNNMLEITLEECERAEYAKIMIDFRNTVQKTSYGRLLFRSTKVARHFDYFSNQDKPSGAEAELDPSQLSMDGVATQEIIQTDLVTTEKISKLWFLPSVTEIVMTSNSSEKSPKGPFDLSQRVYRNIGTFRKALSIQSMLLDIFLFVKSYAHLLQDNRRYVVQVRQVREADYVVNTIGAIKKDMSYQGQQADFVRVEQYLAAKWKLWILKLKLALGCSMYTLGMTVKPYAYMRLLSYQENLAKEEIPDSIPLFQQLTTVRRICFTPRITPYPSPHIFGGTGLKTDAKRLCDKKILELEECLDEFLQATMLNFGENADEVNRLQSDFLLTGLKLLALRRKFLAGIVPSGIIHTREQLQEFFRLYKMKVMVPAIRLYHKMGAKGNASIPMLLRDEMVTATVDFDFNRIAQALFDRCQVAVLQTELQREYTFKLIRQTRIFYDRLADERTGRLFRVYDSLDIPSSTANKAFAFRMTEDDYAVKTAMIHDFVKDLWRANSALLKEIQEPEKNMPANKQPKVVSGPNPLLEHGRVFTCTRDMLGQAITKLARQMSKWQEKRRGEQEHFMGTLMGRMMEMAKTGEKLVKHLVQEKKEWMETYKRDVRVSAFQLSSELHTELASTSVELADLRKQRRTDERRIRYRILDEYDDLVQELVMEINVLRNRFSEYRVNTFQEVMSIMSEAKKDELHVLIDNQEMPANMKDSAKWMIRHEEEAQALRQENHELKMTLLKVRSMFIIKEQALRSMYEKKTRKLAEGSKSAEEKLWDSYREAEVRESTLRRQLAKAQKTLSSKEAECDTLQRHLREEQQRVRQLTPITSSKDRAVSAGAGGRRYAAVGGDNDLNKIAELQDRLSRYEALKIDLILNELQEKTKLVEQMVDEKRKKGGVGQTGRAGGMAGDRSSGGHPSDHRRRAVSARLARPPMVIKAIAPRRKGLGPYSEYREWTAEDESLSGPGQKIEKAVNDHMVEKMNNLALQNKILRQVLEQCNIPVPSEAGDFMEESPLKRGTSESRKSVMWVDQQQPSTSDDLNSEDENDDEPDGNGDLPSTPKARPAQSAPPGGRLRAAQLRSKPLGSAASAGDVKRPPRLPRPNSFGLEPGPVVGSEGRLSGARESATPGSSTTSLGPEEMQKSVQPGSTRSIRAASAVSLTGSTVSVRQSSSLLHSRPTSASDYRISDALRTGTPPPLLPQSRTSSARRDSVGSLHASGSEARFSLPSSPRPMTPRI